VYFGDLECPFCKEFTLGALPSVIQKYVRLGRLRIEYRSLIRAVRTAVHGARAGGARFPDLGRLGDRRSEVAGRARRWGLGVSGSDVGKRVRSEREPVIRYRGGFSEVPGELGPVGLRRAAACEARHALLEDPAEGSLGASVNGTRSHLVGYYNERKQRYATAATTRGADHPHQDRGAGSVSQAGNLLWQELRECRRSS
jgi:hypothetical protein